MSIDSGIRVAVVRAGDPAIAWHAAVVDAIRAVAGVDVVEPRDAAAADVVVDLTGRATGLDPRLGVWRFGFGDGAPVADGAEGTWARLYRLMGDPERATVLHEGWYRSRTAEGWGTRSVGDRVAPWCARVLRQIRLGDAAIVSTAPEARAGCDRLEPPASPTSMQSASIEVGDTIRSWLTRQRWTLGLVPAGIREILDRGRLGDPAWISEVPRDCFYADPFLVSIDGDRLHLLAEEYTYSTRAKRLAALEIDRTGAIVRSSVVSSLPHHASYPFLLSVDGERYCIPETSGARRVAAFRQDAGGEWDHACNLLSGFPAVDATLLHYEGRWWMFCTKQGDEDQTELHLFMAPEWRGPWEPHPLNPVKSDTRSSRPAGACFTIDGRLYRPAQNCARRYGAAITINRIVELTSAAFRERPVLSLQPTSSRWPHGLHTINSIGNFTMVDGLRVEQRRGPARYAATS